MKILGHSRLVPRTEAVRLGQAEDGAEIVVKLKAPRLNSIGELDRALDPPPAPAEPEAPATGAVQRDDRGRILKDDQDRPFVARNHQDPAYLTALATHRQALSEHQDLVDRYNRAKTVGMLLECLGDQFQLDAKIADYTDGDAGPGPKGRLVDYYDAVWQEFEEAGLDLVLLGKLTDAALRLTGVGDDEITQARDALGADHSGN